MPEPRPDTPDPFARTRCLPKSDLRRNRLFGRRRLTLPLSFPFAHQLEESPEHIDPGPELLERELLIGRVEPVIRQPDAREQHRGARPAQLGHDRYRTSRARPHCPPTGDFVEGGVQNVEYRIAGVDLDRIAAVQQAHLDVGVFGRHPRYRAGKLALDPLQGLPGHQPQAHLGRGLRRNHRLGSIAGEAAANAMDLEGGEGPGPLEDAVFLEAGERFRSDFGFEILALFVWEALPGLELRLARRLDILVELRNLDPAAL